MKQYLYTQNESDDIYSSNGEGEYAANQFYVDEFGNDQLRPSISNVISSGKIYNSWEDVPSLPTKIVADKEEEIPFSGFVPSGGWIELLPEPPIKKSFDIQPDSQPIDSLSVLQQVSEIKNQIEPDMNFFEFLGSSTGKDIVNFGLNTVSRAILPASQAPFQSILPGNVSPVINNAANAAFGNIPPLTPPQPKPQNNMTLYYIGAGLLLLVGILFFRKRKR